LATLNLTLTVIVTLTLNPNLTDGAVIPTSPTPNPNGWGGASVVFYICCKGTPMTGALGREK